MAARAAREKPHYRVLAIGRGLVTGPVTPLWLVAVGFDSGKAERARGERQYDRPQEATITVINPGQWASTTPPGGHDMPAPSTASASRRCAPKPAVPSRPCREDRLGRPPGLGTRTTRSPRPRSRHPRGPDLQRHRRLPAHRTCRAPAAQRAQQPRRRRVSPTSTSSPTNNAPPSPTSSTRSWPRPRSGSSPVELADSDHTNDACTTSNSGVHDASPARISASEAEVKSGGGSSPPRGYRRHRPRRTPTHPRRAPRQHLHPRSPQQRQLTWATPALAPLPESLRSSPPELALQRRSDGHTLRRGDRRQG